MAPRKNTTDGSRDYEVGYGKPPKRTQFQPGRSGNPKGRPPANLSLAEEARRLLDELADTKTGSAKIPRRRMLVRALYAKAMQGNVNAFTALIRLVGGVEEAGASTVSDRTVELSKEQLDFLNELQAEFLGSASDQAGGGAL